MLAKLATGDCSGDLGAVSTETVALVAGRGLPDGVAASPVLARSCPSDVLVDAAGKCAFVTLVGGKPKFADLVVALNAHSGLSRLWDVEAENTQNTCATANKALTVTAAVTAAGDEATLDDVLEARLVPASPDRQVQSRRAVLAAAGDIEHPLQALGVAVDVQMRDRYSRCLDRARSDTRKPTRRRHRVRTCS